MLFKYFEKTDNPEPHEVVPELRLAALYSAGQAHSPFSEVGPPMKIPLDPAAQQIYHPWMPTGKDMNEKAGFGIWEPYNWRKPPNWLRVQNTLTPDHAQMTLGWQQGMSRLDSLPPSLQEGGGLSQGIAALFFFSQNNKTNKNYNKKLQNSFQIVIAICFSFFCCFKKRRRPPINGCQS